MPNDRAAREALQSYPSLSVNAALVTLRNYSGFSGARLWRIKGLGGDLCLRAWPAAGPPPANLQGIHRLMDRAREAGLDFVPTVLRTCQGGTWVEHAGRLWDLTTWMPGAADFHTRPTRARLAAACTALAQLHAVWAKTSCGSSPCPAVTRRLDCLLQWTALVSSGRRPRFHEADLGPVLPWAEKAWQLVQRHAGYLPDLLMPWSTKTVPIQPCLCDIWHDHVLFVGDRVAGIVDYGSVKMDHIAVDLARLLGSFLGDDLPMQAAGIEAYRRQHPFSTEEEELVKLLDKTGTVLGASNWLRWLYYEQRAYEDVAAVVRRLRFLVERMERWR